jgi:hypothetical protein
VRSNQSVTLTWKSVPGQSYTVESAASLRATNEWSVIAAHLLATNDVLTLQANSTGDVTFFRVKCSQ